MMIICGLVYILGLLMETRPEWLEQFYAKYFFLWKSNLVIPHPQTFYSFLPVQAVTYMFTHGGLIHILFNMFALYSIGQPVEHVMGSRKFLEYYLFSGVAGGALTAFFDPSPFPVVGASAAISGVLVAFALIFPTAKLMIFPIPVPIKAFNLGIFAFLLSLAFVVYSYINPSASMGGISHFGHLAGMVAGLGFLFGRKWIRIRKK
jgi:membrane associated rhomboid family serine protease